VTDVQAADWSFVGPNMYSNLTAAGGTKLITSRKSWHASIKLLKVDARNFTTSDVFDYRCGCSVV